jgi:ABC-2 type transport system permease protein
MAEPSWPRHAIAVGVFEFRRSVRAVWDDKARFGLMALAVVGPSLVAAALAVVLADAIRGVGAFQVPDVVRGSVALFWLFDVYLVAQRVVSARTRIEADSLILTTVSARTAAVGLLVAETLRAVAYVGLPALVVTGVAVFFLGSPASLVVLPATVLLFVATAVVTGSIVGYAAALLVATSRFVARHKTVLGTAGTVVGMGGYFLFLYPQVSGVSQALLAWVPMGWLADLAVVGTRFVGSPLLAGGAVVASVLVLVGGAAVVERQTVALWFTEPVSPEPDDRTHDGTREATQTNEDGVTPDGTGTGPRPDALAAAVAPLTVPHVLSDPVRRVAEWALLRTRRDPNRLVFLLLPVFAIGSPLVSTAVRSGSVGTLTAPLCAVALPWLAGSAFALNPLGDEGAVLPVTLTAVSGRQYVRGLAVPGLVFGLPLVLVVTGVAGLVSPYTLVERLALVALGGYLTVVSVTVTPAVGMAFPRFSAVSVGQSRDVLPPRMTAVAVHAALTVVPGAFLAALVVVPGTAQAVLAGLTGFIPAFALELLGNSSGGVLTAMAGAFSDVGEGIRTISAARLRAVGGATGLAGGVLVSILLYRNAVSRFERYSPA